MPTHHTPTVRYAMEIPEGYDHKATSDSFNGAERVVIYYSKVEDNYLVVIGNPDHESLLHEVYVTKAQLELLIHAGTDVIEMSNR